MFAGVTTMAPTVAKAVIETDSATTVTFSTTSSIATGLDSDYNTFSLGSTLGFELELGGSAEIVFAELTTPAVSASIVARVVGSVGFRCVRYDAEADADPQQRTFFDDIKKYFGFSWNFETDLEFLAHAAKFSIRNGTNTSLTSQKSEAQEKSE